MPLPTMSKKCVLLALCCGLLVGALSRAQAQSTIKVTEDTVYVCRDSSVLLEAEAGFGSYLWRELNGSALSGAQTYAVSAKTTRTFVVESQPRTGNNLASNPTFDEGAAAGYETEYELNSSGEARPGTYANVRDPRDYDPGLTFCRDADRAPTDEKMMVTSTAESAERLLYRQRVDVEPGKTYLISATAIHVSNFPVRLDVGINGDRTAGTLAVDQGPCDTDQFNLDFESESTEIEIEIYNASNRGGGIFGLDGIVVAERPPSRFDTITVVVTGPTYERLTPGICGGGDYVHPSGERVAAGDSLALDLVNIGGCDSIVVLAPRDLSVPDTTATVLACPGDELSDFGIVARRDTLICTSAPTAGGCTSTTCVFVEVFDADAIDVDIRPDACADEANGAVTVRSSAGAGELSVGWNGARPSAADTMRTGLEADNYQLAIVSPGGCTVDTSITVPQAAPLSIQTVDISGVAGCTDRPPSFSFGHAGGFGTEVTYSVSAAQTVLATGTRTSVADPTAVSLTNDGPWTAQIVDESGCIVEVDVVPDPAPAWRIDGPTQLPFDSVATYTLVGSELPAASLTLWRAPDGLDGEDDGSPPSFEWSATTSGDLQVEIVNGDLCLGVAALSISTFSPDYERFPTAFSPNGDGLHDRFQILPAPDGATVAELAVYDRWGVEVYRTSGCSTQSNACAWDGRDANSGQRLDAGVYVYVSLLVLPDGQRIRASGEVTIVR